MNESKQERSQWRGFNHLALVTPDLDRTITFYRDVLGMQVLMEAPSNPHHGRHCMISPGGPGLGLHFFEQPDVQIFSFEGGLPPRLQFVPGALQHISFTVADETSGLALRDALLALETPTTPVMDQGPVRIFAFPDPSGLLLEDAWFRDEQGEG